MSMHGWSASDVNRIRREQGQDDITPVTPGIPPVQDKTGKYAAQSEKELQATCENWLTLRGYHRMTANNAERYAERPDPLQRGWFGHWVNNVKNPLMADIAIIDKLGLCLMVELKVNDVWQPGQQEMVQIGAWKVAWTFDDFERIVKYWEVAD